MIYFTQNKKTLQSISTSKMLMLNDVYIYSSSILKSLEVILNKKLKYYKYIGNAVKKEIATPLALNCLRNLKYKTTRYLYICTITLVIDYGSAI